MSNKKISLRFFTIPEFDKEADYLSKQHEKGWRYCKFILPFFYIFERCEPEEVVYQLDYNPDVISRHEEYVQMFKDCGWKYLGYVMGYSYFRKSKKDMKEDETIFSDRESKLWMLQRVFRGRMIPLIVVALTIIAPQVFFLSQVDMLQLRICFYIYLLMAIIYIAIFIKFWLSYRKLSRREV